jgi:hypothetical protein
VMIDLTDTVHNVKNKNYESALVEWLNHFRHEYLLEGVFVQILYILVSSRLHIYIKMMDKNILTMPSERSVCWRVPDGQ